MRLNIKAVALACGLTWGLAVFLFTWWYILFEGASRKDALLGKLYRGYRITPRGSGIGLVWGFLDGCIGGALFAWMYNEMADFFRVSEKKGREELRRRPARDHEPWLYALLHRAPGIHA